MLLGMHTAAKLLLDHLACASMQLEANLTTTSLKLALQPAPARLGRRLLILRLWGAAAGLGQAPQRHTLGSGGGRRDGSEHACVVPLAAALCTADQRNALNWCVVTVKHWPPNHQLSLHGLPCKHPPGPVSRSLGGGPTPTPRQTASPCAPPGFAPAGSLAGAALHSRRAHCRRWQPCRLQGHRDGVTFGRSRPRSSVSWQPYVSAFSGGYGQRIWLDMEGPVAVRVAAAAAAAAAAAPHLRG